MKIHPKSTAKSEFVGLYAEMMATGLTISKQDPSRLYNLRCSGLPFCPNNVLTNFSKYKGKFRPLPMLMAYYVSVGTAVHEVMQNYLCLSGKFLADYSCTICSKSYPLSFKYECCDHPTKYDEVTIDVGTTKYLRVQGHIDGIFKDKKGRFWILDFKTSSVAGSSSKEKSSPLGYRRQVRAYAYLLWKQHKIKVAGVMLVYIPRDNPLGIKVWDEVLEEADFDKLREELIVDKKLHKRTMLAHTIEELVELSKIKCKDAYCTACKMSQKDLKAMFTRLLPNLPILKDANGK